MSTALLLIDLQNDFCTGGTLAVPEGDRVIPIANQAIQLFKQRDLPILASQDWHPPQHKSFAVNSNATVGEVGQLHGLTQVWWPVHCVQHTHGADFQGQLQQDAIDKIIYKGENPEIDSYSAFFDNGHRAQTELDDWLREHHIDALWILGLATDYCVKFTVLDALALGYRVTVIKEGCRGVNLKPNDSLQAFELMEQKGASILSLEQANGTLS